MADAPIGISFIPTAENQAQGPMHGGAETDLGQAFKILSLRLPRVLGAQAPAPSSLIQGAGAAGVPGQPAGGFNPHAAVFEALIRALLGGSSAPSGDVYGANTDPYGFGGSAGTPPASQASPDTYGGDAGSPPASHFEFPQTAPSDGAPPDPGGRSGPTVGHAIPRSPGGYVDPRIGRGSAGGWPGGY